MNLDRSISTADKIVADIQQGLRSGRLKPGQRLPEPDLMRRYGVSRGPAREAIQRLHAEGILSLSRNRGAAIRKFSREEMIDVLHVIEAMAGLAARLVASRIHMPGCRTSFQASLGELLAQEEGSSFKAAIQARDDFFSTLIRLSGSFELNRVFPVMQLRIIRLQVPDSEVEETRFADYRAIGRAVLAGDSKAAEQATRQHLRTAVDVFKRVPL